MGFLIAVLAGLFWCAEKTEKAQLQRDRDLYNASLLGYPPILIKPGRSMENICTCPKMTIIRQSKTLKEIQ